MALSKEYCGPVLVSKIRPGPLGTHVPWPRVVSVGGKAERWESFSWDFVVVEGSNKGQFLLATAGRTKAVMVMKVVMVVGCFAACTAPFS